MKESVLARRMPWLRFVDVMKGVGRMVMDRTQEAIEQMKEERRQRVRVWQQEEAERQQQLSTELDAAIGTMTYDLAFSRFGQPQITIVKPGEAQAAWQSGRIQFKWYPVSNPTLLQLFPHGSSLVLFFNAATKLVSWKYSEW